MGTNYDVPGIDCRHLHILLVSISCAQRDATDVSYGAG